MIKLKNVAKIYKPSKDIEVVAIKNISLTINKGEFVTILGSSGSGKSTLLYIIGLLEKPSKGRVIVDQQDVSSLDDKKVSQLRNKTMGFVFQQFNLIPKLNILENVLLPLNYSPEGITQKYKLRALELLDSLGIVNKKDAFPNQLSGGQQQRVAIARALINNPEVIIADEPTGNLDSKTGTQIMSLIKEIHHKENKTIILVTHDQNIAKYSQRIIKINDGEIVN